MQLFLRSILVSECQVLVCYSAGSHKHTHTPLYIFPYSTNITCVLLTFRHPHLSSPVPCRLFHLHLKSIPQVLPSANFPVTLVTFVPCSHEYRANTGGCWEQSPVAQPCWHLVKKKDRCPPLEAAHQKVKDLGAQGSVWIKIPEFIVQTSVHYGTECHSLVRKEPPQIGALPSKWERAVYGLWVPSVPLQEKAGSRLWIQQAPQNICWLWGWGV